MTETTITTEEEDPGKTIDLTSDLQGLITDFNVAKEMHRRMHDNFIGFRVTISMPCSGQSSIDPEVLGLGTDTLDENIELGHMATMPKWITNIGRKIATAAYATVRNFATSVPSIGGYLVHESKVMALETELLSLKGITDEDHELYPQTIIENAGLRIQQRLDRRKTSEIEQDAPVTFIGYCQYLCEHYDALTSEIKEAYRARGYMIDCHLPSKKSLEKHNFQWMRYAQMPSLLMFGETSLQQIISSFQNEKEANEQLQTRMGFEIQQLQSQCQDALNSVQRRVRSEVAAELGKLAERLAQNPMTDEEREAERKKGRKHIKDPAIVTDRSIESLQARLNELTQETTDIATEDRFSEAIQSLHTLFGQNRNWTSLTDREQVREQVQEAITIALNDDDIDANTGEFYTSFL